MKERFKLDFNKILVDAGIKLDATTRYRLDCIETLATGLVFEFRKGPKSEIWPFLNILPKNFSTLLEHWPEKMTILMPNYLNENWAESRRQTRAGYNRIKKFINEHL